MNRSTVWNGDGAYIYFVFQFLEAVFVWEARKWLLDSASAGEGDEMHSRACVRKEL